MAKITYNGQVLKIYKWDSIPMHNFGESAEWADPANSVFTLQPPADEIWVIHSVRIRYSANADFHCPMIVKYYIHGEMAGQTEPVYSGKNTVYKNSNDFISRCDEVAVLPLKGVGPYTEDMLSLTYNFNEPIVLKGTFDPMDPGLIMFNMGIEDNIPIKAIGGGDLDIVEVRYPEVSIYKIPQ